MTPKESRVSARSRLRSAASAPRRIVSERTAIPRAVRAIKASGVFDEAWYRQQLAPETIDTDPIRHYVEDGAHRGLSPSLLFDAKWYAETVKGASRSVLGPFAHYLSRGAPRGDAPHPAFDMEHYLKFAPDASQHPAGALGHFLAVGWRSGLQVNAWFDAEAYRERHPDADPDRPAFLHFLEWAQPRMDAVPNYRDFERSYRNFDHDGSSAFVRDVTGAAAGSPRPLVSVVTPTRDRADALRAAIGSVLGQSYTEWELVIVDDGSVDGTASMVRSFDDPRIRYVRQPASGVCRARNEALAHATGTYVAYLDSDNTWEPRFLEIMVAFLETSPHEAAYSALEMQEGGETTYRGAPFNRGALLEGNYIDCNTLVHVRHLADRIGGWDESLRRTNDWDYVIRLSAEVELGYVPFSGVKYEHDRQRGDRITVREPFGYKFKVMARHLFDWERLAKAPVVAGRTSIVIGCVGRPGGLDDCLSSIVETTGDADVEVIVVDNTRRLGDAFRVLELEDRHERVRVHRPTHNTWFAAITLNFGLGIATGDMVVVLDPLAQVSPGWLEAVTEPVRSGSVVAAQGRIVAYDGTIASAGFVVPADGLPYPAFVGFPEHAPEVAVSASRAALSRACFAARREDLVEAEGFDAMYRSSLGDVDLSRRLMDMTQLPVRYVSECVVALGGRVPTAHADIIRQDQQVFIERWRHRLAPDEAPLLREAGLHAVFRRPLGAATTGPDSYHPVVTWIADRQRPLRWAIKIGPPDVRARTRWGDWHFALALRAELEKLGHEVVVDLREAWYRPTSHLDDVVLCLRGNTRYSPNPDQLNLFWLISHPDMVGDDELELFDHRFVASHPFARKLASRTALPIEAMLQCTDASRFKPGAAGAGDEVLFVGNSRGQLRPVVADALAAGLPVSVYGAHWGDRLPPGTLRADYIPNEQLAATYRSAGVVLNDHWDDMRREGFLSNRLFDLAACEATVVSDMVDGLAETFGPVIRVYDRPEQLADVVEEALRCKVADAEARVALSERVRAEHSFEARAQRLHEVATVAMQTRRPSLTLAAGGDQSSG